MKDSDTQIEILKNQVRDFCIERRWDPFHDAKDLAIGAVTEASELLEHFRFLDKDQVTEKMQNTVEREKIGHELADTLFFILRFAQKYDFDLSDCFSQKMSQNARRYPVEEFKGKNHKSTHSL